ncbi:MAG: hypothetical protein AMJ90_05495 [candidate division Zixibacteria bacterium SM23_73_2]|nr:MAG: hypothetical protein AMJ90_05495 [candidate division Zixibacteria bacterium SM23_73_2]
MSTGSTFKVWLWVCLILFFALSLTQAATTGKIAGTVKDKESGEPLAGVTIMVVGTPVGTSTDDDGDFFLINLPVGNHTIEASLIGYESVQKTGVKVLSDLTTPMEFNLKSSPIVLAHVLTVDAQRPLIQRDLTASTEIVTREQITKLPDAISIQNLISNTAGTVEDRDGVLHMRGGRSGTISYFFDGVSVQEPFVGQVGTRIPPDALEELNITTGGITAEYGEALSGVVNAISQRGTAGYSGKLKLYDGATRSYDVTKGEYKSTERNHNQSAVMNLSGPFGFSKGDRANFFWCGEYLHDNGYLPHNRVELNSQTGKITLKPTKNINVILNGHYYKRNLQRYTHRDVNNISYDFNLKGLGRVENTSHLLGAKIAYPTSKNVMYFLKFSHFTAELKLAPEHLFDIYWDEWPGYAEDSSGTYVGTIDDYNYLPDDSFFSTGFTAAPDFYPVYHYRRTKYNSVGFDILGQVNKYNQIKFGGEYRAYRLKWDDKQFFNVRPYGEKYDVNPKYAAGYLQDKIELKDMIINAGVRVDYLKADIDFWEDPVTKIRKISTDPKVQLSPRVGISHPITDQTVVHFNYGYYYQVPQYMYLFTNLKADLSTGFPLVGNPDMEPEKTVSYELGFDHMLTQEIKLDATVYYKDLTNLATTRQLIYSGGSYTQYTNADYGSVKGVDLILTKIPVGNFSGKVAYTYSIAKGNASSVTEGYYDYFTRGTSAPVWPVKEYPLDFDQRHTLVADLDYRVTKDWRGELLGITIPGAWGVNLLTKYGSGFPYTKTDEQGNRIGMLNEGRMPPTYRIDFKFNKDFYFSKASDIRVTFFTEIENLFDRRNVIHVYSNTGKPDDDGRDYSATTDPDGPATADDVNYYYRLLSEDPQNYDAPRTIRWGLELVF